MATLVLTPLSGGIINGDSATTATDVTTSFLATGHFTTPQTNRALLDFDLSGLGADYTVTAATLSLTVDSNFVTASHTLNLYRVRRRWRRGASGIAGSASWNNYAQTEALAWSTAGAGNTTTDRDSATIGTLAVTSGTGGTLIITLDTTQVAAWVSGAFPNFGLLLQASDESNTTLVRWSGPQDATPANRPTLTITYTPSVHAITDNIIAYYKLDDTGYADASGNAHTLTPHNTPTSVAGRLNNATHCVAASSQYLSTSDAALKLGDQDWTWCGWVKLTDKTTLYAVVAAGGADGTLLGGFKLFYHEVDVLDYFVAQLYSAGAGDNIISDVVTYNAGNPPSGTWLFLAVRHDHTRRWLHFFGDYGSGLSVGDSAAAHFAPSMAYGPYDAGANGPPATPTADWVLGRSNDLGGNQYLNGDIDEVGFWGRWLSVDEIMAVRDAVTAGFSWPLTITQTTGRAAGRRSVSGLRRIY